MTDAMFDALTGFGCFVYDRAARSKAAAALVESGISVEDFTAYGRQLREDVLAQEGNNVSSFRRILAEHLREPLRIKQAIEDLAVAESAEAERKAESRPSDIAGDHDYDALRREDEERMARDRRQSSAMECCFFGMDIEDAASRYGITVDELCRLLVEQIPQREGWLRKREAWDKWDAWRSAWENQEKAG